MKFRAHASSFLKSLLETIRNSGFQVVQVASWTKGETQWLQQSLWQPALVWTRQGPESDKVCHVVHVAYLFSGSSGCYLSLRHSSNMPIGRHGQLALYSTGFISLKRLGRQAIARTYGLHGKLLWSGQFNFVNKASILCLIPLAALPRSRPMKASRLTKDWTICALCSKEHIWITNLKFH